MGSMSVLSCICYMFVSCVHPVAVLNAALCVTYSLVILVEDAIRGHMEEPYLGLHKLFITYNISFLKRKFIFSHIFYT